MVTPNRNSAEQTSYISLSWHDQLQGLKHFTSRLVSHVSWPHRRQNFYYRALVILKWGQWRSRGSNLQPYDQKSLCSTAGPHHPLQPLPPMSNRPSLINYSPLPKCMKTVLTPNDRPAGERSAPQLPMKICNDHNASNKHFYRILKCDVIIFFSFQHFHDHKSSHTKFDMNCSWWPEIWPNEYLISPIEISVNWPGS